MTGKGKITSMGVVETKPETLEQQRSYVVAKANEIIRDSKFKITKEGNMALSAQQQKILLYVISKIKPHETSPEPVPITFNIREFLLVCGYSSQSIGGRNLTLVRNAIDELAGKHMWVEDTSVNKEHLVRWIADAVIDRRNSTCTLTLDRTFWPFLVNLANNYTSFPLREILLLKSGKSIILYELLRSYAFTNRPVTFEISDLYWKLMDTDKYLQNVGWLFQQVIDPAIDEINLYTSLKVRAEKLREGGRGRRVTGCRFYVQIIPDTDSLSPALAAERAMRNELVDTTFAELPPGLGAQVQQDYIAELKDEIRKVNYASA